jgi:lysine-N-methylase
MKLRVLHSERFSCHSCGLCCRAGWNVELLPKEIVSVPALAWPEGDPLHGVQALGRFAGKTVLAHKPSGACVFLDEASNRCRIHEQFGEAAKPLGCRLFPFHIMPTFRNEVSVSARYDCPSVRQNKGATHEEQRAAIEGYARELNLPHEGFDEATRSYLVKEQIEAITEFAAVLLRSFERDEQRTLFLFLLAEWLPSLKVGVLDRAALGHAFPMLKEKVEALTAGPIRRPGWLDRLAFRTLLAFALRRDEDILKGEANRFRRALGMSAVVLGFGSLRGLGTIHRAGRWRRAGLFRRAIPPADPDAMAMHWRMVRSKLGSMQFMGPANGGRDFLAGLHSLALLYPFVLAVAKFTAGNRGATEISEDDIDYAVMAIEHSYGKLPILNQKLARFLESRLLQPEIFVRLARSI